MPTKIPSSGFCVALSGGGYVSCFKRKADGQRAARRLANATGRRVDLVQVKNHGEDRFIVGEFLPGRGRGR